MTNELLKKWIIDKERGVYNIVLERYPNEIESMGIKLFIKWLATELQMDEKQINYNSLNQLRWNKRTHPKKNKTRVKNLEPEENKDATAEKKEGLGKSKLSVFKNFDPGPEQTTNSAINMDELANSGFLKKK